MGVGGLQTYLCGDSERDITGLPSGWRKINMRDKIHNWKKVNNGESPVIVIDAMGILGLAADNQHEIFCGGRHKRYHDMFNKLFSDLIECGATLVFFSDLNIQQWKSDVWLARRDRKYADDCKLFDNIKRGLSVKQFRPTHSGKYCKLVEHALRDAGTKHGTYNYTTKHDCDAELAKYARDHNALAVIAHDSDFLIFEGYWEYWSAVDIDVNALTTVEFNRKALRQHLQLTHKQMPLLATLMGNDYTKANSLRTLYETEWGDNVQRWLNVAKLVRQLGEAAFDVSDEGIAHISAHVFGKNDNEGTRTMIRDSMQSYNLDFVMYEETDALLQKIVHVPDVYEMLTSPILTINMTMYDMREEMVGPLYPLVIAELNKRCVGLLFKQRNMKHSYEFFAKFSHNEKFTSTTMQPVFPPKSVKIPPLIDLLLKEDKQITSPLNTTRLKALLWLLTLEAKYLERIRSVPRAYRLIAVTLKFMRQHEQITPMEADIILITETQVMKNETAAYLLPEYLVARSVHVAHLYGEYFCKIRLAFIVTGLGGFIDNKFRFDGVAYHNLRTKFSRDPALVNGHLQTIQPSRLHSII